MDLVPQFPTQERMILLTECAKFDPAIVQKIKGPLMAGKSLSPAASQGPRMPTFGRRESGPRTTFTMPLKPHSYRALRYQ